MVLSNYLLYIQFITYFLSLIFPTYCNETCPGYFDGLVTLFFGWAGIFIYGIYFFWYANVFVAFTWMTREKHPFTSLVMSVTAFIIALGFYTGCGIQDVDRHLQSYVSEYKLGYWLWLLSTFFGVVSALINFLDKRKIVREV